MLDMRRFHKYEFKKHANRMFVVFVATTLSLVIVLVFEVSLQYTWVCTYELVIKNPDYEAMFEPGSPDQSICKSFMDYQFELFGNRNHIGIVLWLVDLTILIPSLTFFAVNQPHDCFVCLGKDPERIYSRFQLNREERVHRVLRAKSGRLSQSLAPTF